MPWNLFLIPLVGGYFILTRCYLFKFKQQRLDKQRLIFDSVLFGIMLITFTFLLKIILCVLLHDCFELLHEKLPVKKDYFGTAFASLIIAYLFVSIANYFSSSKIQTQKAITDVGNELEKMLMRSFVKGVPLQFTLDTQKIYIAWGT